MATLAGLSAAFTPMAGTLVALAPEAAATAAPGQAVENDWGQTPAEVTAEVSAAVAADARVVSVQAARRRAGLRLAAAERTERAARTAARRARRSAAPADDKKSARAYTAAQRATRTARAADAAARRKEVDVLAAVATEVRDSHYLQAPYVAPPAQPTGLTASPATGQVSLSWSPVAGAASYRVLRDGVELDSTTATAYTVSGLEDGTTYQFSVRAVNVAGWSPLSAPMEAAPTPAPPSTPAAVTASVGDRQVRLSWSPSTSTTGYRVLRDGVGVDTTTDPAYVDDSVDNGTAYVFTVVAMNGAVLSAPSLPVTCTPVATAPAAPTGLVATAGDGQVSLTWDASTDATAYGVLRDGALVASRTVTTTYLDAGLVNGDVHRYAVVAYRENSPASPSSGVAAARPLPPPPVAPAGLSTTPGDSSVRLTWSAVPGALSYRVLRGTTVVATAATTTHTVTGLVNGTAYGFSVVAVGPFADSAPSATVTATPVAPVAGAPTGLTGTAGDTTATLSWTAVTGASGYRVYRNGTQVGTPSSASYSDTGLSNGTAQSYTVSSLRNGAESARSAAVSVTPVPTVPAVPTGLVATAGNAQVSLTWATAANAKAYQVFRGGVAVGGQITATSFVDTGRTNGTAYTYIVQAINGTARSTASSPVVATPMAAAPAAPTGLTAVAGNARVQLSWTAVPTATTYRIFRNGTLLVTQSGATYLNTGLTNGQSYSYSVRAVTATTEGPASATVTATPTAPVANGTFTGNTANIANGRGSLNVVIVVVNGRITTATGALLSNDGGETRSINSSAIPKYNTEAVAAQSATIAKVSGATLTWTAYKTSLQSALTKAGL